MGETGSKGNYQCMGTEIGLQLGSGNKTIHGELLCGL